MKKALLLSISLLSISLLGQESVQSVPSIDRIMQGEDFVGVLPRDIQWSEDSKTILFQWNPDGDTIPATYGADPVSGEIRRVETEEMKLLPGWGKSYNRDYTSMVYEKFGDLYLLDLATMETRQITATMERESSPVFSGDEKSVVYRNGENLFRWDLGDGSTVQLTNFQKGTKKNNPPVDEKSQWLEEDQLRLFEVLSDREDIEHAQKYRMELLDPERPSEVFLGNKRLGRMTISPDLRYVIYGLSGESRGNPTKVPDYVTSSGFTEELNSRSKVGWEMGSYDTWILDTERDTAYQVNTGEIEGIRDKPVFLKEYADDPDGWDPLYEKPRQVYPSLPVFSDDGKALVNIRAMDHKDRWVMLLDLEDGSLDLIDRQHDDAWIGGPGVGWMAAQAMGWIDNENIYFQSEETGYSHLYRANVVNGKKKALTKGKFEVLDVELSRDRETFYMITNEVSPFEQHFYHMDVEGGKRTQITSLKGGHEVEVSPDEKQLAIRYSYANKPWELYTMANKPGEEMVQLTESLTEEFKSVDWMVPEIVDFKASDGVTVPASLYKPGEGKANGAGVIFVHGAGYLQNVHYWWPSYYREYMFHNFLVEQGYTVLAIDFRASAGYGRDWRTAIYRHMGGRDLLDQVDGAAYLSSEQGVDAGRIGIYGGSYGGFMTLMAMFRQPETFKCGAALRSVTDWAHYNHGYTSPILNTPVEDSLSYVRSSPIYYAEGLEGELLMLHGMIDTNVHFQDVVRLSQRLIELKKENWELAVFPLEGHGFKEGSSWSDEYRRIYKLFEAELQEK